jgi:RNA polymerase sigma factor (sigma-70 family)
MSGSLDSPIRNPRFVTTHWSMVRAAAGEQGSALQESRQALETLCRQYWYPLYAHIRRRCKDAERAYDLTQEFFTRMLDKEYLKTADDRQGRFRTFLLTAVNHFLANEHDKEIAQKRGGGQKVVSIDLKDAEDRLAVEPVDGSTPESIFEKRWALTLLERVLEQLRDEYRSPDKLELFVHLHPNMPQGSGPDSYRQLSERLRMSESAVKVALHRMRRRFGVLLRRESAHTVDTPNEVDNEINSLFTALSR